MFKYICKYIFLFAIYMPYNLFAVPLWLPLNHFQFTIPFYFHRFPLTMGFLLFKPSWGGGGGGGGAELQRNASFVWQTGVFWACEFVYTDLKSLFEAYAKALIGYKRFDLINFRVFLYSLSPRAWALCLFWFSAFIS